MPLEFRKIQNSFISRYIIYYNKAAGAINFGLTDPYEFGSFFGHMMKTLAWHFCNVYISHSLCLFFCFALSVALPAYVTRWFFCCQQKNFSYTNFWLGPQVYWPTEQNEEEAEETAQEFAVFSRF